MNEALRRHVTMVGFQLTLTRRQIGALVWLHCRGDGSQYTHNWVTPIQGCERRGLVQHHYPPVGFRGGLQEWKAYPNHDEFSIDKFYVITPAGFAVIQLLMESGIYAETVAILDSRVLLES